MHESTSHCGWNFAYTRPGNMQSRNSSKSFLQLRTVPGHCLYSTLNGKHSMQSSYTVEWEKSKNSHTQNEYKRTEKMFIICFFLTFLPHFIRRCVATFASSPFLLNRKCAQHNNNNSINNSIKKKQYSTLNSNNNKNAQRSCIKASSIFSFSSKECVNFYHCCWMGTLCSPSILPFLDYDSHWFGVSTIRYHCWWFWSGHIELAR